MNHLAKKMLMERFDGRRDERYYRDRDYDGERDYRGRYRMRDGRNPYGSRGGYVHSTRDGRYDDGRTEYRRGADYRGYESPDYEAGYDRDERYGEYRRDYHDDEPLKIHERDMKEWERRLQNADGTSGVKYDKDTVRSIAEQESIKFDKFSHEDLYLAANMMYSDYCIVARKYGIDRADFYVCMAKAFLEDKDFDGEPSEKLAMYYYCIVDGE